MDEESWNESGPVKTFRRLKARHTKDATSNEALLKNGAITSKGKEMNKEEEKKAKEEAIAEIRQLIFAYHKYEFHECGGNMQSVHRTKCTVALEILEILEEHENEI